MIRKAARTFLTRESSGEIPRSGSSLGTPILIGSALLPLDNLITGCLPPEYRIANKKP
jgi:hypothetical protein